MGDSTPTNFFSGSPLNRLSWLRTSQPFLNAILVSESARWVVLRDGKPLLATEPVGNAGSSKPRTNPARLTTAEIRSLLGPEPFFAQGEKVGELAQADIPVLEAARIHGPPIVFLGLQESEGEGALPSSDFGSKTDPAALTARIKGTPYFAIDVTDIEQSVLDEVLQSSSLGTSGHKLEFIDARAAMRYHNYTDAAILAEARSMIDWNVRNKFCPACGSPVYSLWAGWKLSCTSLLPWSNNSGRKPCPTATGLHNYAHPRTDAVVITVVTNEANDKILLGRNRKWPGSFYSAMAGFIEPAEALEDAVKREIWEEAGVKVWGVKYHSTQPWPFPANLMVGFYALADDSLPTRVDLDNELEDARWFTREEILAVLNNPEGTNFALRPPKSSPSNDSEGKAESTAGALAGDAATKAVEQKAESQGPAFRLPPITAIAGLLISDWAHKKVFIENPSKLKGSL
ncbi:hypothetical protein K474DRAFT_1703449 [Panus rudis PR-1116 ss-1]|nr:hypothetical protein K474DRAFT_1703449 [Panus rudis PR-1116 ss-1]